MKRHNLAYWQHRASSLVLQHRAFIDGQFSDAAGGETFPSINPGNGSKLASITACHPEDIDRAVAAARRAFESGVWSRIDPQERKACLLRLSALINQHAEDLALLETLDSGKPISDVLAFDLPETAKCFAWYAEAIDKIYGEIAPTSTSVLATITREPVGVVAAVVPWNFPLMISAWKIAPALALGNSVILKPAEQTSLSALRLAELMDQAGIPAGVFNVTPGPGAITGQALGRHPDVDCLAFTGSTATGKRFLEYAAQSNLKQVWLECGGKSPHIIFDDCPNLEQAARAAAAGIFSNQGEICIAGSRLYVQDTIYPHFMEKLLACLPAFTPGNPLDPESTAGAMIDETQLKRVLAYIESGKADGAQLRAGGQCQQVEPGGYYLEPTVFECTSAQPGIAREEIFGPVLAVFRFETEAEAIRLANDSPYGLGAGLWSADLARANRVSRLLRAGLVWVNCYMDGNITVPFGGVKQSGSGRDKSLHALDKYSDLKTTRFNLDY
jgi:gamma-glutamyl-gamma-aminobutyraldehyde dehydrogenase